MVSSQGSLDLFDLALFLFWRERFYRAALETAASR
jgi:hypothetical protein